MFNNHNLPKSLINEVANIMQNASSDFELPAVLRESVADAAKDFLMCSTQEDRKSIIEWHAEQVIDTSTLDPHVMIEFEKAVEYHAYNCSTPQNQKKAVFVNEETKRAREILNSLGSLDEHSLRECINRMDQGQVNYLRQIISIQEQMPFVGPLVRKVAGAISDKFGKTPQPSTAPVQSGTTTANTSNQSSSSGMMQKAGQVLKQGVQSAVANNPITNVAQKIGSTVQNIGSAIKDPVGTASQAIKNVGSNISAAADKVDQFAKNPVGTASQAVKNVANDPNKLKYLNPALAAREALKNKMSRNFDKMPGGSQQQASGQQQTSGQQQQASGQQVKKFNPNVAKNPFGESIENQGEQLTEFIGPLLRLATGFAGRLLGREGLKVAAGAGERALARGAAEAGERALARGAAEAGERSLARSAGELAGKAKNSAGSFLRKAKDIGTLAAGRLAQLGGRTVGIGKDFAKMALVQKAIDMFSGSGSGSQSGSSSSQGSSPAKYMSGVFGSNLQNSFEYDNSKQNLSEVEAYYMDILDVLSLSEQEICAFVDMLNEQQLREFYETVSILNEAMETPLVSKEKLPGGDSHPGNKEPVKGRPLVLIGSDVTTRGTKPGAMERLARMREKGAFKKSSVFDKFMKLMGFAKESFEQYEADQLSEEYGLLQYLNSITQDEFNSCINEMSQQELYDFEQDLDEQIEQIEEGVKTTSRRMDAVLKRLIKQKEEDVGRPITSKEKRELMSKVSGSTLGRKFHMQAFASAARSARPFTIDSERRQQGNIKTSQARYGVPGFNTTIARIENKIAKVKANPKDPRYQRNLDKLNARLSELSTKAALLQQNPDIEQGVKDKLSDAEMQDRAKARMMSDIMFSGSKSDLEAAPSPENYIPRHGEYLSPATRHDTDAQGRFIQYHKNITQMTPREKTSRGERK